MAAAVHDGFVYSAHDVAEVLERLAQAAAGRNLMPSAEGTSYSREDLHGLWDTVVAAAGADGRQEMDPASLEHLKALYQYIETVIISCGAPDAFDIYEVSFEALTKMGFFLHSISSKELLISLLEDVHEVYDVLLSCVETYEWLQPGATGLVRLWMLQVIFACFGCQNLTGRLMMELTDNDVSGAVSLISFLLQCAEAPFEMQSSAGQCLVELTSADSVFLGQVEQGGSEDMQNEQIAKLTGMLNKHVNGLIKGIIQFDVVESFGRCICKHQMSHSRTDIIVKAMLTTVHNSLLYCSENQKKLRQHLATQSTIVQDIMIPYVDNILPALYDMPDCGPINIEWQNLKATLQTFVVVTFNINAFRQHFYESDMLPRIFHVPNILAHVNMLELLIKLSINVDITKSPQADVIASTLQAAFERLPAESQARLQRRMQLGSMRLPYTRGSTEAVSIFACALASPGEGGGGTLPPGAVAGKTKQPFSMHKTDKTTAEEDALGAAGGEESDDEIPPLEPVADWSGALGPSDAVGVPSGAVCSLSGSLMHDPVTTPEGHLVDRAALEDWTTKHHSNPFTGAPMSMDEAQEAPQVRGTIEAFQMQMLSKGSIAKDPPTSPTQAASKPTSPSGPSLLGELPTLDRSDTNQSSKPKKQKGKIRITSRSVVDCPDYMCCAVDGKVMVNPLRSPYGHHFEKKTLDRWMANCGSVCPITGKPLRLEECVADAEMKKSIVQFLKGAN
jgi:hypothetical protein